MKESSDIDRLIAHTPNNDEWHTLKDHLLSVGEQAQMFGEKFNAADSCYLAGLWHDIGKAHPDFQSYLRAVEKGQNRSTIPHAIWGAGLIHQLLGDGSAFREIGLPIAGHHSGLKEPSLVSQDVQHFYETDSNILTQLIQIASDLPSPELSIPDESSIDREFRARMILSSLVDADRLDTEAHFDPAANLSRQTWRELTDLWDRFTTDQQALIDDAPRSTVNNIRREVYEACLAAAESPPGLFRLTVPTGGGKTRSSLGFGLKHSLHHDMDRVIVAIPYTSIIDQTARAFRQIMGDDSVLEHHSNVTIEDTEGQDIEQTRLRLATENWDAPLVVTTTVQLFESLFSHHPSQVRKIHRISNSVIVLDEAQTLPVHLLEPIMDALTTLIEQYNVTIVLSTATQPALQKTQHIPSIENTEIHEIVSNYPDHFEMLKRVTYEHIPEPIGWEELAENVSDHDQVLTILNTRRDALALLDRLPQDDSLVHLSSLLCPAHRMDVLDKIRHRLDQDKNVRVVSTQVVEAGVDIDFPTVYRAIGPLDRIVQAAGRCNREGMLDSGIVRIFEPKDGASPRGPYRHGMGLARRLLQNRNASTLNDPRIFENYFDELYAEQDLDAKNIQHKRRDLDFREVSRSFKLIEDDTVTVVVDYRTDEHAGNGPAIAKEWSDRPSRTTWSKLQPYTVSVYRHNLEEFLQKGSVSEITNEIYMWNERYDDLRGLVNQSHDPADLVR